MNLKEYQFLASVTANPDQTDLERKANMALGLAGEAGETADHIKKDLFHGHELDRDKLVKELGDVLWYVAMLARAYGIDLEEVGQTNIAKLKARYGDKFTKEKSINRPSDATPRTPQA